MDADTALMLAYDLGKDDAGWTEEVMDEAEKLLPALVAAGYAAVDDETSTSYTWWFTDMGIARIREIEARAGSTSQLGEVMVAVPRPLKERGPT